MPTGVNFSDLVRQFRCEGVFLGASPYGHGHIHDTYAARFRKADGTIARYILQRINRHVFPQPEAVMHNIEQVTDHLRRKITAQGGDPARQTITLIPTVEGTTFYRSPQGDCWRAEVLIEGARTYETAASPAHVYQAAKAFGRFQRLLSDFPPGQLFETIPDFHHTGQRFQALVEAVARDAVNRARQATAEIAFAEKRAGEVRVLVDRRAAGAIPERVIHNDTKLNNVMIDDETGEGICVIDLDTVMPGLAVYDFGDAVRGGANPAAEDERDLSQVGLDLTLFEHLARGYLEETRDFLTPAEMDSLAFAAKLISFEQGLRFLTDYLNGDVYYRTHRPDHNLDRCRTQFKLVSDIEAKFDQMARLIQAHRAG